MYETYWTTDRGTEAALWSYGLMDLTVLGRQEAREDSPPAGPESRKDSTSGGRGPTDRAVGFHRRAGRASRDPLPPPLTRRNAAGFWSRVISQQ